MKTTTSRVPQRVLVVDTEDDPLAALRQAFQSVCGRHAVITTVRSARALSEELGRRPRYEVVVVDYVLGDGHTSGADLLAELRAQDPLVPVVAVSERGDVDMAMSAVHAGATDFLVRGDRLAERVQTLVRKIRKTLGLIEHNRTLGRQTRELELRDRDRMIGDSPLMTALSEQIDGVASIPRPVLILGERGTGKELVARAIHARGFGPSRPFVVVNCAAFSDALLESELFGHERGAYTGADSAAPGRFEQADGGTLFLDELGNMGLAFQRKILRTVEYGTFTRVGGTRERTSLARIVAATNADLPALIAQGRFLPDLYDRLAFEVIRVPPLREHPED
ncbi:MAG TPA: Fis family transcriptional regulator, partial [Planctomycetes bacterium]|nr:Fis family transcriptional regulator [Planctomycetota bacterium]